MDEWVALFVDSPFTQKLEVEDISDQILEPWKRMKVTLLFFQEHMVKDHL